jgi:arylsulfatase A-like enzyme
MRDRPNILFALADDTGMHFGAYGCPWVSTPAFDRVAQHGVLFTNAYTCNSKCAPSRASIITGRNSWQLKDAANHQCYFPAEFRSVWEALRDHGYNTGHTAKGWAPGDPGTVGGRPRELTGPAYADGMISREEFPGQPQAFARIDADQSGQITQQEAVAAEATHQTRQGQRRRLQGMVDPQARWERLMDHHDADGNGEIARQEFGGPDHAFARLDADGNGSLTKDEVLSAALRMQQGWMQDGQGNGRGAGRGMAQGMGQGQGAANA